MKLVLFLFILLLFFILEMNLYVTEKFNVNNSFNKKVLIEEIKKKNSINTLREINKLFSKKFHEHTYILYDLRTIIGEKQINYLEIGSYIGSSASLLLNHKYKSNIYCIDPLNLNKSHFNGIQTQEQTLNKNLTKNNKYDYNIEIIKGFSNEKYTIDKVKNIQFDLFFIDGDHSYKAVKEDFYNYHNFVKKGGFIVFDDYLDYKHSPEVKQAVDDIVSEIKLKKLPYEVIGSLPNYSKALNTNENEPIKNSNEFILYKSN